MNVIESIKVKSCYNCWEIGIFMKIVHIVVCLLFAGLVTAQDGHHIKFKVENYAYDSLVIGYYYGERTLVLDTLSRSKRKSDFVLKGEESLPPGLYLMLTKPDNQYIQFLVNPNVQEFTIKTDVLNPGKVEIKGSEDNTLFHDYIHYLAEQRKRNGEIKELMETAKNMGKDTTIFLEEFKTINNEVEEYQRVLIQKAPKSITAAIVKSNLETKFPEFEGDEKEQEIAKYRFYKDHYFDNMDLGNPALLRTSFLHQRVMYYLEKLTIQMPDSIIESVDYLLDSMKPASDTYKYYIGHFLNTYAKSKIVGMDAVYVHLAEKYYATGIADWLEEESLNKIVENARRLKPLLINKIAPDFKIQYHDGSPFQLSQLDADYKVLVFWAPDCGHCTKSMPDIIKFQESFKDRGVRVIAICNKTGSDYEKCWEGIEEKGMQSLLNVGDQYQKSRILSNYYITSTPKIFILDRNDKILFKDIASDKLELLLDEIIGIDEKKKNGDQE